MDQDQERGKKVMFQDKMTVMKAIFFFQFMLFFPMVHPAFAEMNISDLEVKAVISNDIIVEYSWTMDVYFSEEKSMNCKLKITFFNDNRAEIHSKSLYISLSNGSNHLTGKGICNPDVWTKIKEYKAHITCP